MPQYMLLLYNDKNREMFTRLSREEMESAVQKYLDWRKKPFTVDGHRLTFDFGRVVRNTGATDGPYSETKEILGGYYTVGAANYDEATALAISNPHVEYGGTIEVREVFPVPAQS